jgi:hypothetical protein
MDIEAALDPRNRRETKLERLQRRWRERGLALQAEERPPNTHLLVFTGRVPEEGEAVRRGNGGKRS